MLVSDIAVDSLVFQVVFYGPRQTVSGLKLNILIQHTKGYNLA